MVRAEENYNRHKGYKNIQIKQVFKYLY